MNAAKSANVLIRLRGNDDLFRVDFDGAWDFRGLPLPLKLYGEVHFAFWCSISPNLKRSLIMDSSKGTGDRGMQGGIRVESLAHFPGLALLPVPISLTEFCRQRLDNVHSSSKCHSLTDT